MPGPVAIIARLDVAEQVTASGVRQHQLRLPVIDAGRMIRQHCQMHAPRTALERRATGQDDGPHHAGRAAEDGCGARQPLVKIARPRHERLRQYALIEQAPLRGQQRFGIQAERIGMQLPQWSGPSSVSRPGFNTDEGDRAGGAHRVPHDGARVGVDAAWNVQREHRKAQRIDFFHQLGKATLDRGRCTQCRTGRQ